MDKRKKFIKKNRPNLQIETTPVPSVSQTLSKPGMQAILEAFSNSDDHAGLELITSNAHERTLRTVAKDMLAFSDLPTSFSLQEYFNLHGIFPSAVARWKKSDEYFKNCHELAKERIGTRREKWGATREMDPSTMMRYAGIYSHEFRDLKEWETALAVKAKQAETPSEITINVVRRSNVEQQHSGQDNGQSMRLTVGGTQANGDTGAEEQAASQPEDAVDEVSP